MFSEEQDSELRESLDAMVYETQSSIDQLADEIENADK